VGASRLWWKRFVEKVSFEPVIWIQDYNTICLRWRVQQWTVILTSGGRRSTRTLMKG